MSPDQTQSIGDTEFPSVYAFVELPLLVQVFSHKIEYYYA